MSIVTLQRDGTITLTMAKGTVLDLPEPTAREYAQVWDLIDVADAALPVLPPMDVEQLEQLSAEERAARRAVMQERRRVMYNPDSSPHGLAMCSIVLLLTGREVTMDDLHRDALKPNACFDLLQAWEIPLGGPDEEQSSAPVPVPLVLPSDLDSSEGEPSSPVGTDDSSPSRPQSLTA